MPIIKNAEIWYTKLDPKRPNKSLNKKIPTWEIQIRTKDKEVKKAWEEMDLNVKLVEDEKYGVYYRVNLKKKAKKETGEDNSPVKLVDGKLDELDPNSIGNGSIGNIRIWQREYEYQGKKGIASTLMAVQIIKHVVYTPKPFEDEFDETETEVVMPEASGEEKPDEDF